MPATATSTVPASSFDAPAAAPDRQPLLLVIGLAAAFWPLLPWYLARMRDGSDDPLGVLALAAALFFLWRSRHSLRLSPSGSIITLVLLGTTLVFQRNLPPLLEGVMAMAALCSAFALPRRLPGVAFLLALSLPVVATLQFFLGYPLRVFTASVAKALLSCTGMEAVRAGTQLLSNGLPVGVDPPCSGVRMLWMGCFAAAALAASRKLGARAAWSLMGLAVPLLLLANGLRAALLFPGEAGMVHWPHWLHEAIGLLAYAPALALLVRAQSAFARKAPVARSGAALQSPLLALSVTGVLGLGIATSMLRPLMHRPSVAAVTTALPWPKEWNGLPLEPLELTSREKAFAAAFPGRVQRFRCGFDEVVLRQVDRATRLLHNSRDCFQAAGYDILPQGEWQDAAHRQWSRFTATRDSHRLAVSESITGPRGESWNDPGAWFWFALFNPAEGPWLAVTWIKSSP